MKVQCDKEYDKKCVLIKKKIDKVFEGAYNAIVDGYIDLLYKNLNGCVVCMKVEYESY